MKRISWNNGWYFTPHYEPALTALKAPREGLAGLGLSLSLGWNRPWP